MRPGALPEQYNVKGPIASWTRVAPRSDGTSGAGEINIVAGLVKRQPLVVMPAATSGARGGELGTLQTQSKRFMQCLSA